MKRDIITLVFLWVLLLCWLGYPAKIESYFFPVIENVEFHLEPTEAGKRTLVLLEFDKLRGDCRPDGIKFYSISNENGRYAKEFAQAVLLGDSKTRFEGHHVSGPYLINRPMSELATLEVDVTHRCHPIFNTNSTFNSTKAETN